jgi:TrmH family RNA methyltransferase
VVGQQRLTPRSAAVKSARSLTRRSSRLSARRFLVEGPQAISEALALPGCVVEVFATYDGGTRHAELRDAAQTAGVAWRPVDDAALRALTETVTPQGVVAVCAFVDRPVAELVATPARLLAICADVRDPGNAGTVIRCADAAGADGVVLAGSSVDPYNGKVVRASVGSLFHLPVSFGASVADAVAVVRRAGMQVLAADGAGATSLDALHDEGQLRQPTAWLFGNEAHGLEDASRALADDVVRVPIYGRAESLNLATAAAVCLYASARELRRDTPSTTRVEGVFGADPR